MTQELAAQDREFERKLQPIDDQLGLLDYHRREQTRELDELKTQKIFIGCDLATSRRLSQIARDDQSMYAILDEYQRQIHNRDFKTEKKEFQKELLHYRKKLDQGTDLVMWFSHFDDWADKYEIPQHYRWVKVSADLLNEVQKSQLLQHNHAVATAERIVDYTGLKKWLYSLYDSKKMIMKKEYALTSWKQPPRTTLEEAFQGFRGLVTQYCHEIRFALDYGVDQHQIVKPAEGRLFTQFLNALGNDMERRRIHELFIDIGGAKRLRILGEICKRVDAALRPGLGINDFVRSQSSVHIIEQDQVLAMQGAQEKKWCDHHNWCLHTTDECRVLKGAKRPKNNAVMLVGSTHMRRHARRHEKQMDRRSLRAS